MALNLKPYRCQNRRCSEDKHGRLIFDFWAGEPICPKCGVDGRKTPHVIVARAMIHYDPPHPAIDDKGQGRWACHESAWNHVQTPFADFPEFAVVHQATGNPTVVNCPACMETEEFKIIADEWGIETVKADKDFAFALDPKTKRLVKIDTPPPAEPESKKEG